MNLTIVVISSTDSIFVVTWCSFSILVSDPWLISPILSVIFSKLWNWISTYPVKQNFWNRNRHNLWYFFIKSWIADLSLSSSSSRSKNWTTFPIFCFLSWISLIYPSSKTMAFMISSSFLFPIPCSIFLFSHSFIACRCLFFSLSFNSSSSIYCLYCFSCLSFVIFSRWCTALWVSLPPLGNPKPPPYAATTIC